MPTVHQAAAVTRFHPLQGARDQCLWRAGASTQMSGQRLKRRWIGSAVRPHAFEVTPRVASAGAADAECRRCPSPSGVHCAYLHHVRAAPRRAHEWLCAQQPGGGPTTPEQVALRARLAGLAHDLCAQRPLALGGEAVIGLLRVRGCTTGLPSGSACSPTLADRCAPPSCRRLTVATRGVSQVSESQPLVQHLTAACG